MIRVLIADDHAVVRRGLRQIVDDQPDMRVAAEAVDGRETLQAVRATALDVAIVDISMPGRGGLEVLHELKEARPRLGILVLSMHAEEQYALRCLRDGASAYLTKGCEPEELVRALRTVASGRKYITPSIAERLADRIDLDAGRPPHEALSDRELQVLVLLGCGRTVGEAAAELHLSAKTVSTYRARILVKMGMSTNAQLIRYALQNGLAD